MLEALKKGGKHAMGLGGATFVFVFLEEYASWAREEWLGDVKPRPPYSDEFKDRTTWRRGGAKWQDGAIAGSILGTAVGLLCMTNCCHSGRIWTDHRSSA